MSNVTTTDRNIDSLLPVAQKAVRLLFQEIYKSGIDNVFLTETYRSQLRQNYLYTQGRTRSGNIVTWTLSSRHTSKLAWDIAVGSPNALYDEKVIGKVANIAKKLGINAGHFWTGGKKDSPHFEVSPNWTIPKGYSLDGVVSIPTNSKDKIKLVNSVSKLPKVELEVSDSKNNIQLDKGEIELEFTSPTLRSNLEKRLSSPASEKLILENAIKELGYSNEWLTKETENGDILAMTYELAIKLIKEKK